MLKLIITVIIGLLILRFVARLFLVASSSSSGGGSTYGHQQQQPYNNPNIKVNKAKDDSHRHHNDGDAEYIDYEEVN